MYRLRSLLLLLPLLLAACTTNDGDIGEYFGEWAVDEVTIDSHLVETYPYGRVYWRFQADLLVVNLMGENHVDNRGWIARWTEADGHLTVDFDQRLNEESSLGRIPAELLIPPQQTTSMQILLKTTRALVLCYLNDRGETITFTLRKIF